MLNRPAVGDPLPDFVYTDVSGQSHRLSELWAEGPVLLLWLRHFG
jgi:peroxiredoxin